MRKNYVLFILFFIFSCGFLSAQSDKTAGTPKSAVDRYKFDFEIKDNPHPDSVLLSKIRIETFDYLRLPNERVEAKDPVNGIILILYSESEVKSKKSNFSNGSLKSISDSKNVTTPKLDER